MQETNIIVAPTGIEKNVEINKPVTQADTAKNIDNKYILVKL